MSKLLIIIAIILLLMGGGIFYLIYVQRFDIAALYGTKLGSEGENFQPYKISGQAMFPNYKNGQYYLADSSVKEFRRGDVVIFESLPNKDQEFIKRIVSLPGEKIKLEMGKILINGSVIDEPYIPEGVNTLGGPFLNEGNEIEIPAENYFVIGDNRKASSDSREWGFIKKEQIVGKITTCYKDC